MSKVKMIECPSCALEAEAGQDECPYCGYEFPQNSKGIQSMAWLMVFILIWPVLWLINKFL